MTSKQERNGVKNSFRFNYCLKVNPRSIKFSLDLVLDPNWLGTNDPRLSKRVEDLNIHNNVLSHTLQGVRVMRLEK